MHTRGTTLGRVPLRRAIPAAAALLAVLLIASSAGAERATTYEWPWWRTVENPDMAGYGSADATAAADRQTGVLQASATANGWNPIGGQHLGNSRGIGYNYAYAASGVVQRFAGYQPGYYAVVVDIDVPDYTMIAESDPSPIPPHGGGDAPLSNIAFADILALGFFDYEHCKLPADCHSTSTYFAGERAQPGKWIANSSRGSCCTIAPPAQIQLMDCVKTPYLGDAQVRVEVRVEARATVTGSGTATAAFDAVKVSGIEVTGPFSSCPVTPSPVV